MQIEKINDIRTILADEISRLRTGDTNPENVNAIVNATGKMLASVKLEMQYAQITNRVARIEFMEDAK